MGLGCPSLYVGNRQTKNTLLDGHMRKRDSLEGQESGSDRAQPGSRKYAEQYWHCSGNLNGASSEDYFVVNDLTFSELRRKIVEPWSAGVPFNIAGTIIRSRDAVGAIRIVQTAESSTAHARRYDASLPRHVSDMGTDRRLIVFDEGEDHTHEFLFDQQDSASVPADEALVLSVCKRIGYTAKILAHRRGQKRPFLIGDEYDVQDLLHATLRAVVKFSVQEDPLSKVAATRSGRADISIEELGTLIEVKFVRGPQDQKRLVQEFSEDLVLYSRWSVLRTLIFLIYNSGDLRDPEALLKLEGIHEVGGRRFQVRIVLS